RRACGAAGVRGGAAAEGGQVPERGGAELRLVRTLPREDAARPVAVRLRLRDARRPHQPRTPEEALARIRRRLRGPDGVTNGRPTRRVREPKANARDSRPTRLDPCLRSVTRLCQRI